MIYLKALHSTKNDLYNLKMKNNKHAAIKTKHITCKNKSCKNYFLRTKTPRNAQDDVLQM